MPTQSQRNLDNNKVRITHLEDRSNQCSSHATVARQRGKQQMGFWLDPIIGNKADEVQVGKYCNTEKQTEAIPMARRESRQVVLKYSAHCATA